MKFFLTEPNLLLGADKTAKLHFWQVPKTSKKSELSSKWREGRHFYSFMLYQHLFTRLMKVITFFFKV